MHFAFFCRCLLLQLATIEQKSLKLKKKRNNKEAKPTRLDANKQNSSSWNALSDAYEAEPAEWVSWARYMRSQWALAMEYKYIDKYKSTQNEIENTVKTQMPICRLWFDFWYNMIHSKYLEIIYGFLNIKSYKIFSSKVNIQMSLFYRPATNINDIKQLIIFAFSQ